MRTNARSVRDGFQVDVTTPVTVPEGTDPVDIIAELCLQSVGKLGVSVFKFAAAIEAKTRQSESSEEGGG
jgi:hypothetical protein